MGVQVSHSSVLVSCRIPRPPCSARRRECIKIAEEPTSGEHRRRVPGVRQELEYAWAEMRVGRPVGSRLPPPAQRSHSRLRTVSEERRRLLIANIFTPRWGSAVDSEYLLVTLRM